jgi:hypothetical protein
MMIKKLLHILKKFLYIGSKKDNSFIFVDETIVSFFTNVRQCVIENSDTTSIYTKDLIPHKSEYSIEYIQSDLYSNFSIKRKNTQNLIFKNIEKDDRCFYLNFSKFISEKYKFSLKQKIDKKILYLISELGRLTASAYGQARDTFSMLTISKHTNTVSLINKIQYADNLLKELNNIGLKHIVISNCFYEKLKDKIYNNSITIHNKEIQVQVLPDYLEKIDPICLICSSVIDGSDTPGIIYVHKRPEIKIQKQIFENEIKTIVDYTQEYEIQKCGTKPEFFYVRFYQT